MLIPPSSCYIFPGKLVATVHSWQTGEWIVSVLWSQPDLKPYVWATRAGQCLWSNGQVTSFSPPLCHVLLMPQHQYAYSPYCFVYIPQDTDKKSLYNNHELLYLVIISFILITFMFDSGVILYLSSCGAFLAPNIWTRQALFFKSKVY